MRRDARKLDHKTLEELRIRGVKQVQSGISPEEVNSQQVNNWLKKVFPKIKARAKLEKADIYFADEAGVRSDYHSGTTWVPEGETPVVQATGARFSVNMISAVSSRGDFRFMVVEGSVGTNVFVEFLKRLMAGSKKKVFLIVDGYPAHKSKKNKGFCGINKRKVGTVLLAALFSGIESR